MLTIPALGLGTWGYGGKFERDPSTTNQSIVLIREALKIGYRLIDMAEIYGQGLTEEIVGQAIQGFPREQLYLVSKVWKEHLKYEELIVAVERSLRRLQINYLDLYLIHWPMETVPFAETMPAMEKLVKEGKVRGIGVSNFSVAQLEEAQRCLASIKLVANQIEYNLFSRAAEQEIIPYCRARGITVISYRPLAKGKIPMNESPLLREIANKYNKTPAQVALNWLIAEKTVPIPKAGSVAHLQENFGALGWQLATEDTELLRNSFPLPDR